MPDTKKIKKILLVPLLILAWLLHGLSEWLYEAASWVYEKCGTSIAEASINWEE